MFLDLIFKKIFLDLIIFIACVSQDHLKLMQVYIITVNESFFLSVLKYLLPNVLIFFAETLIKASDFLPKGKLDSYNLGGNIRKQSPTSVMLVSLKNSSA